MSKHVQKTACHPQGGCLMRLKYSVDKNQLIDCKCPTLYRENGDCLGHNDR